MPERMPKALAAALLSALPAPASGDYLVTLIYEDGAPNLADRAVVERIFERALRDAGIHSERVDVTELRLVGSDGQYRACGTVEGAFAFAGSIETRPFAATLATSVPETSNGREIALVTARIERSWASDFEPAEAAPVQLFAACAAQGLELTGR